MPPALDQANIRKRLMRFIGVMVAITTGGTIGYMVLEGWPFIDSLYMTVITLSTVGFREVAPLSVGGRLFTIALIVAGVSNAGYLVSAIGEYVVSGELRGVLRSQRMLKKIERLEGHYIVCGFGRVGRQVVEDLDERGQRWVIVESDEEVVDRLPEETLYVSGDASEDAVLRQAGIERASGLVAATGDDATNVFITLTARALRSDLVIVTRVTRPGAEPKAVNAGATHVISPYTIAGRRIATQLLYPSITDFLDAVVRSHGVELGMEEVRVAEEGELAGRTMAEAQIRSRTGVNVVAVWRPGQTRPVTAPPMELRFRAGDTLVGLGTPDQLGHLLELAGDGAEREHG